MVYRWGRTILSVAAICVSLGLCSAQRQPAKLAITNVTVIDPASPAPIANAVVLVEGNRIRRVASSSQVEVPAGATVIDGKGRYLIPGLADMHHHGGTGYSAGPDNVELNLRRMLAFGFTTIFSTGYGQANPVPFSAMKAAASDHAALPRYFGVGGFITVTGGHASDPSFGGPMIAETIEAGRRLVRENKAMGADAIKFIYDDMARRRPAPLPKMRPEVMKAIIDESHVQGLKVYVHATGLNDAKEVLRNGADGLVHGQALDLVDDEFIQLMKARQAIYITTHALYNALIDPPAWAQRLEGIDDRHTIPADVYQRLKQTPGSAAALAAMVQRQRTNLKKVYDSGILVIAGTDTSVPGVLLGVSSQAELMLLVEDGLTPMQALQTATINAAKMLGREKLQGSITEGKLADLVLLDADPLADMRNVRRVHRVIKDGAVYDPVELLKPQ